MEENKVFVCMCLYVVYLCVYLWFFGGGFFGVFLCIKSDIRLCSNSVRVSDNEVKLFVLVLHFFLHSVLQCELIESEHKKIKEQIT